MKRILPPHTVLRLRKLWPYARKQGKEKGQIFRVGYYCKGCGVDTIWLVDENGEYGWTVDRNFIDDHFEIVRLSTERSIYGKECPQLKPLKEGVEKKGSSKK